MLVVCKLLEVVPDKLVLADVVLNELEGTELDPLEVEEDDDAVVEESVGPVVVIDKEEELSELVVDVDAAGQAITAVKEVLVEIEITL